MTEQCVRQAWLTLGNRTMALQNEAGGWVCTSLDLGFPEVRAVVSNRPDQHGVDDRSQFFGARAVGAQVLVTAQGGGQIDDIAGRFAPFMDPSVRPVLHYVLDRPGAAERTITVRAANYGWPIEGASQRDVQLQWIAADPLIYAAATRTAVAYAGSTTSAGRTYDLVFPRVYPSGGGMATTGRIQTFGDVGVKPLLRIYGPIQGPYVGFSVHPGDGTQRTTYVRFVTSFQVDALHWVDVDTDAKTAYRDSDPNQPVFSSLNFAGTTWTVCPPAPVGQPIPYTDMWLGGSGAMNNVTQVQAFWQDAFLS